MARNGKQGRLGNKRRQIIAAATRVFGQYGFRKSSVELVAAEAQVAKPTLYAYFENKEALFEAVCAHVADVAMERVRAALAGAGLELDERVLAVLSAKFEYFYELIHSSGHAQELIDAQASSKDSSISQMEESCLKILTELLVEKKEAWSRAGLSARALATLLASAGHGISSKAKDVRALREGLKNLTRLVIAAAHG